MTDINDSVLAAINMFQHYASFKNVKVKDFKLVFSLAQINTEIEKEKKLLEA